MRRTRGFFGSTWADVLAHKNALRDELAEQERQERERQQQVEQRQPRELVHSAPWNPEDCQ